jgi:hypothetical protein
MHPECELNARLSNVRQSRPPEHCSLACRRQYRKSGRVQEWLNANTLLASLIWGSVGVGFFIYGKKQGAMMPLIGGVAMIAISYLVPNWLLMSLISLGLIGAIWFLSKRGF